MGGDRGRGGCHEGDGRLMGQVWPGVGVHGADINTAPTPRDESEPRNSNDSPGVLRRRDRSCQRCGHWIGWRDRLRGVFNAKPDALTPESTLTFPSRTPSGSCPGGPAVPTQHRLGPAPPAQRATALGPGQLASQQCHETPQHPALGRRLWSGPPTSVLRRRTSEPPRSQEAAPCRTSGGGRRPAITTRVARETLCHVDVTVRTVLRWHAFHFQHGD